MYRVGRMVRSNRTISHTKGARHRHHPTRRRHRGRHRRLRARSCSSLAEIHAPEFLEIAVTMPQAKLLYLLGAVGRAPHVRPRRTARRLAVHGQRPRRPDRRPGPRHAPRRPRRPPPGRRRAHRPRARPSSTASATSTPPDARRCSAPRRRRRARQASAAALAALARARRPPRPSASAVPSTERTPHEPPLRARRRQAERHAAAGGRAVHRGHRRLGQPPAGAPARHRVAGDHRRSRRSPAPARPTSPSR